MDTVAVQKTTLEKCIVCDEKKLTGIHLFTSFICSDCERDMVNTDTSDPKYKYYIDRLKSVKRS
ncbi:sigma factor G inhibitor Gin [Heyndrickxia acidicola]|uniref:Sigma factor G inhibitor Gin n=1 Tax=Heyndrickxia acidicola TaxID=209389 RepID=A0ABU6MNE1_9BACI|nr:sigma factor G inhibitor Gin [Heyndrickxia acidicola]MED1206034.1 sigma factor G inhibitor Gin [Heyndrickxia acidicola]